MRRTYKCLSLLVLFEFSIARPRADENRLLVKQESSSYAMAKSVAAVFLEPSGRGETEGGRRKAAWLRVV